jgi:hypothetical protein
VRREEEGKADKRAPLVSYPGRKVKGCDAVRPAGWARPQPVGCVSRGKKRRREAGLGRARVGRWAIGPSR